MPSSTDQTLQVSPIPAFNDNYIWMIDNRKEAVIVDPGEAGPVLAALQKRSLKLCAIVLTHRHEDHIGGVSRLLQEYSVPVYGPRFDPIESGAGRRYRHDFRIGQFAAVRAGRTWPYQRSHCLLCQKREMALLRRHAVRCRLRPHVRRYAGTDVDIAFQTGSVAGRR